MSNVVVPNAPLRTLAPQTCIPVLLMHCDDDQIVACAGSAPLFAKRLPPAL